MTKLVVKGLHKGFYDCIYEMVNILNELLELNKIKDENLRDSVLKTSEFLDIFSKLRNEEKNKCKGYYITEVYVSEDYIVLIFDDTLGYYDLINLMEVFEDWNTLNIGCEKEDDEYGCDCELSVTLKRR